MYYHLRLSASRLDYTSDGSSIVVLSKYDQGKTYTTVNNHDCFVSSVDSSAADLFGWTRYANYAGKDNVNGISCDKYTLYKDRVQLATCVKSDNSTPVYLTINGNNYVGYYFKSFTSSAPSPDKFTVPKICR